MQALVILVNLMNRMDYEKIFFCEEIQEQARIICELAEECWSLQLSDSTGFSISHRISGTDFVLVDKSGTGFRRNKIQPEDLLLLDINGQLLFQPNMNNPRLAPVNTEIHLAGYRNSDAGGCIHWHDPYTNAFACYGRTIHPLTLQSKLLGDVSCVIVDDREQKRKFDELEDSLQVPSGFHCRPDVYYVMNQVGEEVGKILSNRNIEFEKHGISVTHYEHGLFAFGRHVEEAFENGYRTVRNAQTILNSMLLENYPDERALQNKGNDDNIIFPG